MRLRYTLLLGGLLTGAGTATAQTPALPDAARPTADTTRLVADSTARPLRVGLGLTGGANYASFLGSDARNGYGAHYRWGYQAGLMADVRLGRQQRWALHPEVLYVRKGSSFNEPALDCNLTTLDVPVLLRYYTPSLFTNNAFFMEGGPLASFLLRARRAENDARATQSFNRVNLEFMMGVGYRVGNVSVGLRYSTGITPLYKTVAANRSLGRGTYDPNATSDVFALSLGYMFRPAGSKAATP